MTVTEVKKTGRDWLHQEGDLAEEVLGRPVEEEGANQVEW